MKKIRAPSLWVFSACALLLVSVVVPCNATSRAGLEPPVMPNTESVNDYGQTDYHWTIYRLNGEAVDFSVLKNRIIFLHFWATWCRHCALQMSSIQKLHDSFRSKGKIAFVIMSYQDKEIVRNYLTKKGLALPIYLHGQTVPSLFGPQSRIPRTFIIDRSGNIIFKHIGGARWDDESVLKYLESLLK